MYLSRCGAVGLRENELGGACVEDIRGVAAIVVSQGARTENVRSVRCSAAKESQWEPRSRESRITLVTCG